MYVVGTQKNQLNVMVLLRTQNKLFKLMYKKKKSQFHKQEGLAYLNIIMAIRNCCFIYNYVMDWTYDMTSTF